MGPCVALLLTTYIHAKKEKEETRPPPVKTKEKEASRVSYFETKVKGKVMRKTWKLTGDQKLAIIRRYKQGELVKVLAMDFHITDKAIYDLIKRRGIPLRQPRSEKCS